MLKGHVFYKQIFGNPIFALFINTFLNGRNGVSDNYKNGMSLSYSGSTVTVNSGAVCVQGRFLEEDTSTAISAGTDSAYCKLVIEIDLDKINTETEFNQASYKVVKSTSNYPSLTQTNIVKNNSGVYQYELARFRTSANGITNFEDKRTFLNFSSIYDAMETEYRAILQELEDELQSVNDGSAYVLNNISTYNFSGNRVSGTIRKQGNIAILNFSISEGTSGTEDFDIPDNFASIDNETKQYFVSFIGTLAKDVLSQASVQVMTNFLGFTFSNVENSRPLTGSLVYFTANNEI